MSPQWPWGFISLSIFSFSLSLSPVSLQITNHGPHLSTSISDPGRETVEGGPWTDPVLEALESLCGRDNGLLVRPFFELFFSFLDVLWWPFFFFLLLLLLLTSVKHPYPYPMFWFLNKPQRSRGDRYSIHSVSSVRGVMSGMSGVAS